MKRKKKGGTAPRSLTLTYAQLEFLDGKPNASAWVRGAIDEIREIRSGQKVVIDRPKPGEKGAHWERLIEAGFKARGKFDHELNAFDRAISAMLDFEEAYEKADKLDTAAGGAGEKPFMDFMMKAQNIANELRRIIRDREKAEG